MYFLFMFKEKPPRSSRLSERFFLLFHYTIEEARSVPKISCNSSHHSLISFPVKLVPEVWGEGRFLGANPSLYCRTTVLEGTVEPVELHTSV